jgi:hypothetical protein
MTAPFMEQFSMATELAPATMTTPALTGDQDSAEGSEGIATASRGARVAATIADAGGVDAVALGIKESLLLTGQYWPQAPDAADLEARAVVLATLDAQLDRLGDPGRWRQAGRRAGRSQGVRARLRRRALQRPGGLPVSGPRRL